MNSNVSVGDNQAKQYQLKKEEHKNMKMQNDGLEQNESSKIGMPGEGNEPSSENQVKNLELDKKVDVEQLNDNQNQETSKNTECDDKSPSGNKFKMKNDISSSRDNHSLKAKSDWSNGIVNSMNDMSDEEEMKECCRRKRKRLEINCANCKEEFQASGLTCVGILPGLGGTIESSDDSDQSCSSASEGNERIKYDLLGRSIVYEAECSTESG